MKSMTGYGASERRSREAEISVVVKAVNGRFLESRFHLPKEYFGFENQLKKILGETVRRGTLDVFIHRRGVNQLKVAINKAVAKKWVDAHKELARSTGLKLSETSLLDRVATMPLVFDTRDRLETHPVERNDLIKTFKAALANCDRERLREGVSLKSHLRKLLSRLNKIVVQMERMRANANVELENKLRERMRKLGLEGAVDPVRFAQELVMYLDKSDISEELARLKEHVHMCDRYLNSRDSQGKKLDFYCQELLREVNTVGSKANHAGLTEQVVEAKGLVEAIKEQVQNIE